MLMEVAKQNGINSLADGTNADDPGDYRPGLKALKELDPDIKVILSTGFGLNEAAQAILDAGALGFAQKPYRVTDLSEIVAAVMRGEAYLAPPTEVVAD